jgi:L-ribulose-5-phosphate 4-epimerase
MNSHSVLEELVTLSLSLGSDRRDLAILAEGNVSVRCDDETFWVKASGMQLGQATCASFVRMKFKPILAILNGDELSDSETKLALEGSRWAPESGLMPSVETFMHAYLLTLPGVEMVGHTHPTSLLSLLCVDGVKEFARQRLFPDDVVCCGPESAFVPYVDPGLPLARAIRVSVEDYVERWSSVPKTIWLQNHGLIVLGQTRTEIESGSLMSSKAASVWLGALGSGHIPLPLTPEQIERIHTRPDEHYRQRLLWHVKNNPTS